MKPSSSYSLLKFVYLTSQLCHSLVVHPFLRKKLGSANDQVDGTVVEPRFKEVPRDRENMLVISSGVRFIKNLEKTTKMLVLRCATREQFWIWTITVNKVAALMSIWSYSTLCIYSHDTKTKHFSKNSTIATDSSDAIMNMNRQLKS